jgi:molybdenum cofactor biosynthesis enzyme MoaA
MKMYFDMHDYDKKTSFQNKWDEYCSVDKDHGNNWTPFLSFPITKACNFRCIYCGSGGEATASNNIFIQLPLIEKYVSYASSIGIHKIRITGGEPFLHPNISEILHYLGNSCLYTLVNTNGSLLKKHEDTIKSLPNNIKFAVSLDTLKPETLTVVSSANCLQEIKSGLQLLSDTGHLLRINTVISKYNNDEIYDIISYCDSLHCDLKILDIVSVPVPYSTKRQSFYTEVNSLEQEFAEKCDAVYTHEYSRGFGTPCYRYKFGDVFVTVKNSKKGSHYDLNEEDSICRGCKYFPCHEGLYDIFCLSDGRLCSCRWTEKQKYNSMEDQMQWLIKSFKRAEFYATGDNKDMATRTDLE